MAEPGYRTAPRLHGRTVLTSSGGAGGGGSSRRERLALDVVPIARVEEQCGIEAVHEPLVDHDRLAASALLGGRAEEDDLTGPQVARVGQRQRRAHALRRHRVEPAAMTETGQRVVL